MTTERQKAANQANARHSTGPQTQRGKAVVRLNALRHGLLARDVVLPGESADAFEELLSQVRAEFAPVGPIEELLVDRLVKIMWRLCRLDRVETALFDWRVRVLKVSQLSAEVNSYVKPALSDSFGTYITDETAHTEAQEALARAAQERDGDDVFLGRARCRRQRGRCVCRCGCHIALAWSGSLRTTGSLAGIGPTESAGARFGDV
jgi:hypothetical protein